MSHPVSTQAPPAAFTVRRAVTELVAACQEFVRADGGFRVIYLHTNTRVPAVEPFWRSLPVAEVLDDRDRESDPRFATVHVELPMDRSVA